MTRDAQFRQFIKVIELIIRYFKWLLAFAGGLIILSSVYTVESHEVAVVLRFGQLVGVTPAQQIREPGLHFALPFFIDEVIHVPVHTIHERELITHYSGGWISPLIGEGGYLLTADHHLVLLRGMIRYQITHAPSYVLFNNQAGEIIEGVVSGVLTQTVTTLPLDHVLTTGRGQLGQLILQQSQLILDELGTGVSLTSVELTDITPPEETAHGFEAVRSAAVASETALQVARDEAALLQIEAQVQAGALTQQAILDQAARLTEAHHFMAEFNGLYDQYQLNPQLIYGGVIPHRLLALLEQVGQVIIVPEGTPPMMFLP